MHRCPGGACSASGGEAIRGGVTHRIGRVEARMGFDPGDRQVMMLANSSEETSDALDEGHVTASLTQYSLCVSRLMRRRVPVEEGLSAPRTHRSAW